jgi:hypothetical protein
MTTTNNKLGTAVGEEGRSIYLGEPVGSKADADIPRFIVTFAVGYGQDGGSDGIKTPQMAAAAALALTRDSGSEGTCWFVFDRETGEHHCFDQSEFISLMEEHEMVR